MQTKLTLRLEAALIEEAKLYAEKAGKSVSQMVAEYFSLLISKTRKSKTGESILPPLTLQLKGLLRGKKVDTQEYFKHLESKYS